MDIAPLGRINGPEYDEVRAIYESSFPERQRQPFDELVLQARGPLGDGLIGLVDLRPVGFVSWTLLEPTQWAFVEFLAVDARRRGFGLGQLLWSAALDKLRKTETSRLILEVEDPASADNDAERVICERRIRFYLRLGARPLPVADYVVPNLGGPGFERFLLMWQPVREPEPPSPEEISELIKDLLVIGYGLAPDDPLVEKVTSSARNTGHKQ
jgi:GNAT superfamily N-acetyltransferase